MVQGMARSEMSRPHGQALWLPTVIAGLALAVGTVALLRDPGATTPGAALTPQDARADDPSALRSELAALRQRVAALETATPRQEVFDQGRIEQMIAKALVAKDGAAGGVPVARVAPAGSPAAAAATARLLQELAQTSDGAQRDELWKQLRELGGVDAAIEQFEKLAQAQPGSADAQTDLGAAYIQKLLQTTDENQRIELGKKIDAQFDQALALQPDHWEARFRKAVGLTYGPALSGRQDEAIGHFEKLVEQQANRSANAQYAQTYLYLGRLYAQRGDTAKAQQIWQQGLARHPQDAELLRATTR